MILSIMEFVMEFLLVRLVNSVGFMSTLVVKVQQAMKMELWKKYSEEVMFLLVLWKETPRGFYLLEFRYNTLAHFS